MSRRARSAATALPREPELSIYKYDNSPSTQHHTALFFLEHVSRLLVRNNMLSRSRNEKMTIEMHCALNRPQNEADTVRPNETHHSTKRGAPRTVMSSPTKTTPPGNVKHVQGSMATPRQM